MSTGEKDKVLDRRAFLRIVSRPSRLVSLATNRKFWNITVLMCSCRDKTSIDMADLALFLNKLGVGEVLQHSELCGLEGRSFLGDVIRSRPSSILVAACMKQMLFRDMAMQLDYPAKSLHILELQELCGWVHRDSEMATEKAKRMIASTLARISADEFKQPTTGFSKLATSKALDSTGVRSLYGRLDICPAKDNVCLLCVDFCPQKAVAHSGGGIVVDRRLCVSCGICGLVCPLELLKLVPQDDQSEELRQILMASRDVTGSEKEEILGHPMIAFVCENEGKTSLLGLGSNRMSYPEGILPVFVRCLGDVSTGFILKALNWGAQGVVLLGCQECNQDSQGYTASLVDMFRDISKETILDGRVHILRSDRGDSERLSRSLKEIYARILEKEKLKIEYDSRTYEGRRDELLGLLCNLRRNTDLKEKIVPHKIVPIGYVDIETDNCDLCLRCVDRCPTSALRVKEGILLFDHARCIGCELCVKACERKAMRFSLEIRTSNLEKEASPVASENPRPHPKVTEAGT